MLHDIFEISEDKTHIRCYSIHGNIYSIDFDENHNLKCSCNGFKFRQHCRHINNLDFSTKNQFAKIKDLEKKDNFCRHCGKAFEAKDNFCGNCGKKRA